MGDSPDEYSFTSEQFQGIIDERNAEYVEEVNREEAGRIPLEVDDPLKLLPPEVWRDNILVNLAPQDMRNVKMAHPGFRDLSDERLTLLSTLRNGNKDEEPSLFYEFHLENPVDQRRLVELKLELVNDSLSGSSDLDSQRYFPLSLCFSYRTFRLTDMSQFQNELHEIIRNTNMILDHVGDRILYFTCEFSAQMTPLGRFTNHYQILSGWLSKMKNLKWIKFINLLSLPNQDFPNDFGTMEDLVLPQLPELERVDLKLHLSTQIASQIINRFMTAYPHVKILNVIGKRRKFIMGQPEPQFPIMDAVINMPTLNALEVLSVDGCSYLQGDMRLVNAICERSWKLKRLDLTLDMGNESVFAVFRSLKKFRTLEKLCLTLENVKIGEDMTFIRLPLLNDFELKIKPNFEWNERSYPFFFSLNFLLHVKKLKTLVWKCDMRISEWETLDQNMGNLGPGRMIQFEGGMKDMTVSNIWRVFPWLETIKTEAVQQVADNRLDTLTKEYRKGQLLSSKEASSRVNPAIPDMELKVIRPAPRPV